MRILGISGSLRASSYNTALLREAGRLLPPGARFELYPELAAIPPFNEDHDTVAVHPAVAHLRAAVAAADALIVATPEYNASIPGQLKNALDWASRPYPDNSLRDRPTAVVATSTGSFGAVWARAELVKVLRTSGARVVKAEATVPNAVEAFDSSGRLADPAAVAALRALVRDLTAEAGCQEEHEAALVAAEAERSRRYGAIVSRPRAGS